MLRLMLVIVTVVGVFCGAAERGGADVKADDEFNIEAGYSEIIRDLLKRLDSDDANSAQDAAMKLARLRGRSIPVLEEALNANFSADPAKDSPTDKRNPRLAYNAALALSRIRMADAARPLMRILKAENASPAIRIVAMEALGMELLPEAGPLLKGIAAGDPSIEMRRRAYGQISVMPNLWVSSEALTVAALRDPDDEIRAIAAKQCMYARAYRTGTDKLIELAEKDPSFDVRLNALLALSRMFEKKAVPAMVRVCLDETAPPKLRSAALNCMNQITREGLKNFAAVEPWWKRIGEKEYAKLELSAESPPADGAAPAPKTDGTLPPPAASNTDSGAPASGTAPASPRPDTQPRP